jgi:hypothetical protein
MRPAPSGFRQERAGGDDRSFLLQDDDLAAPRDVARPEVVSVGIRCGLELVTPSVAHPRQNQLTHRGLIVQLELAEHTSILPKRPAGPHASSIRRSGALVRLGHEDRSGIPLDTTPNPISGASCSRLAAVPNTESGALGPMVDRRQIAGSGCVPGLVAAHSVCRRRSVLCADQRGFQCRGSGCAFWARNRPTALRGSKPLCVKGPFRGASGQRRGRGRSVVVGSGSDCSEVPVFRVQPATLD